MLYFAVVNEPEGGAMKRRPSLSNRLSALALAFGCLGLSFLAIEYQPFQSQMDFIFVYTGAGSGAGVVAAIRWWFRGEVEA